MKDELRTALRKRNPEQLTLQELTPARVMLGRAGSAICTADQLRFQHDHALARDAVHVALDVPFILEGLRRRGLEGVALCSAACRADNRGERRVYLQRPDLGRRLDDDSALRLKQVAEAQGTPPRVAFIFADGLSAVAIERHALPLLDAVREVLSPDAWPMAPTTVVQGGRVAIGDEIGALLRAPIAVVFIGERPGLSAPDSLGVYITFGPRIGRTDAERNCISNVRLAGLSYELAARQLVGYLREAERLGKTGVDLERNTAMLAERT